MILVWNRQRQRNLIFVDDIVVSEFLDDIFNLVWCNYVMKQRNFLSLDFGIQKNALNRMSHLSGHQVNHMFVVWFLSLKLAMGVVRFRFGSVSRQRNQTEQKSNRLFKQKPNQTVYEILVFKPNHLRKSWNQTV